MALWVAVHGLVDGENNSALVLNRPIFELVERTNYLYSRVSQLTESGLIESMRLIDVPLQTTGTATPVVGDVVYLNPDTDVYAKALSGVASDDVFSASMASYAVGILITAASGVGTVVTFGKLELSTSGSAWALSSILETGEVFRNGPYYLSAIEPGKLTASPSGPSIYVGYITEDPDNPGYGGFILLSPQYKDMSQSHVHRNYPLYSQPAGTQYVTGLTPADTHEVRGFEADTLSTDPGDQQPRLVITGTWDGTADTQYTIWLSTSGTVDTTPVGSSPPTSFDHYIHWTSSDAEEGSGVERMWSYEVPVAIGTKGLMASLENNLTTDWDIPYAVTTDAEAKRTWTIRAPLQVRGWLANKWRQTFTPSPTKDYSIILLDGPHTSSDDRTYDTLVVKCAELYRVDYVANPSDGDTLTINTTVYEFDDDGSVTSGNISVLIGTDDDESFGNLVDAIVEQDDTGVDTCLNTDDAELIISVPTGTTVTSTGIPSPVLKVSGAATFDFESSGVSLFAYDENHRSLLATPSYLTGILYWDPQELLNGLSFMAVPYDSTGTAAASPGSVAVNDEWSVDIVDEANGTPFRYSVGMHSGLSQYYPPLPVQSAALTLNGVEMDSYDNFPLTPVYRAGMASIYWYSDLRGSVPWPLDWESVDVPGSLVYAQNVILHFVRMGVGNSGVVTSIRPAQGSPLKITQCGTTDDATVGDLEIDLSLTLEEESASLSGYQVFKAAVGNKLRKGPVVEKIVTDGSIQITQSAGAPAGQGVVSLSVASASYSGEFEEVALQNAKQELIGMFPYIRLNGWTTGSSSNVPTAFVAKFRVDHTIDPTKEFKVIVYMTVFGESDIAWIAGGTKQYAGIQFSYSVLPDFVSFNNPGAWPSGAAWNQLNTTLPEGMMTMASPMSAAIPFGKYDVSVPSVPIYSAYDPMLIHNNPSEGADVDRKMAQVLGTPFPVEGAMLPPWTYGDPVVKAGYLVGIRVARADLITDAAEYTGNIGFINLRWRLVSV